MSRIDRHAKNHQNTHNRICVLNQEESRHYLSTGELPRHSHHSHVGKDKGDELTSTLLFTIGQRRFYEAYWVGKGKRVIKFHDAKGPKTTVGESGHVQVQWLDGGAGRWPAKL